MESNIGTILKIPSLDKTKPGRDEGALQVRTHKGQLIRGFDKKPIQKPFDELTEIREMLRMLWE